MGYAPYIPHLTHFWHTMIPNEYSTWLELDLEWLCACDAVLRLPGESSGADNEVAEATKQGIPVVYSIDELRVRIPVHEGVR